MDQIFILRQMIEKRNEHGLDLHTLFIGLKQASDSVNRETRFEVMGKMGITE